MKKKNNNNKAFFFSFVFNVLKGTFLYEITKSNAFLEYYIF